MPAVRPARLTPLSVATPPVFVVADPTLVVLPPLTRLNVTSLPASGVVP